eukprot:TRINITY_DN584_c0_g1_i3.p1 TRINITY_DN584_c0_g1~~TRINITY_DN584_c0_g1_i3.p1  ORF type:complete len:134 (+),score=6.34 TRINITY_DN584_c0_g1_i3:337-738(+)
MSSPCMLKGGFLASAHVVELGSLAVEYHGASPPLLQLLCTASLNSVFAPQVRCYMIVVLLAVAGGRGVMPSSLAILCTSMRNFSGCAAQVHGQVNDWLSWSFPSLQPFSLCFFFLSTSKITILSQALKFGIEK